MMDVVVRSVSKEYEGGVAAISGVDLRFESGKTTVIVGPSGSGKTTLLNIIGGLLLPTSGSVAFGERDVTHLPPEKRDLGFVFQSYALFPHLSVEENIGFGLLDSKLPRRDRHASVERMLKLFHIEQLRARRPAALSGGEKQRVAIARALARNPAVLLLDEPLSALDAQLRDHLRGELKALLGSVATTTIYVTHDRADAMLLGDSVAVMRDGRVLQHASPDVIYRRPVNGFVARFFGEANLIAGHVDASGQHVTTLLGRFATDAALRGGPARVLLRPEMFVISPSNPELQLRVTASDYLGALRRVRGTEANGIELIVDVPSDHVINEGETIPLRVARNAVHVIQDPSTVAENAHVQPVAAIR